MAHFRLFREYKIAELLSIRKGDVLHLVYKISDPDLKKLVKEHGILSKLEEILKRLEITAPVVNVNEMTVSYVEKHHRGKPHQETRTEIRFPVSGNLELLKCCPTSPNEGEGFLAKIERNQMVCTVKLGESIESLKSFILQNLEQLQLVCAEYNLTVKQVARGLFERRIEKL